MCTAEPKKKPVANAFNRPVKVNLWNYDWVILNTSGGKDSQTLIKEMVRMAKEQDYPLERMVGVHADLGKRVEWDGTRELAEEQVRHYGLRFEVVTRPQGDLLEQVRQRAAALKKKAEANNTEPGPAWPSPTMRTCTSHQKTDQIAKFINQLPAPWPSNNARYCTSDHKRGQVAKVMTQLTGESRLDSKKRRVRILNCMGMRAGESSARSKLKPFKLDKAQTNGRRIVHAFLPLFSWSLEQVWADVKASGVRHHHAYDLGMPRLSCCFCIYAPKAALMLAGKHNRSKLDEYVKVEQEVGSRFRIELSLAEVRDALDNGEEPGELKSWEM